MEPGPTAVAAHPLIFAGHRKFALSTRGLWFRHTNTICNSTGLCRARRAGCGVKTECWWVSRRLEQQNKDSGPQRDGKSGGGVSMCHNNNSRTRQRFLFVGVGRWLAGVNTPWGLLICSLYRQKTRSTSETSDRIVKSLTWISPVLVWCNNNPRKCLPMGTNTGSQASVSRFVDYMGAAIFEGIEGILGLGFTNFGVEKFEKLVGVATIRCCTRRSWSWKQECRTLEFGLGIRI